MILRYQLPFAVTLFHCAAGYPDYLSACRGWKPGDPDTIMGGVLRDGTSGGCVIESAMPSTPTPGQKYAIRVKSSLPSMQRLYSSDGRCWSGSVLTSTWDFELEATSSNSVALHCLCADAKVAPYVAEPVGQASGNSQNPQNGNLVSEYTFDGISLPDVDMKFSYEFTNNEKSIQFKVQTSQRTWVAFGISEGTAASMTANGEGADVLVCTGQQVLRYWVKTLAYPTNGKLVPGATCEHVNGKTIMTVTREVVKAVGSSTERNIRVGKEQQIIFAHGEDGDLNLVKHHSGNYGAAKIDWETGKVDKLFKEADGALYAHIICMILAWGLLLPTGAIISNSYRRYPQWLSVHISFQLSGWGFQLIGLSSVIYFLKGFHMHSAHSIVGIIVCFFGTLAPFIGYFRPNKIPDADEQPLPRKIWQFVHKRMGWLCIALAFINIALGVWTLYVQGFDHAPKQLAIGFSSAMVFFVIMIWIFGAYRTKITKVTSGTVLGR